MNNLEFLELFLICYNKCLVNEDNSLYAILDPRKPGNFIYKEVDYVFSYEPFYIGRGKGSCYKRKYRHLSHDVKNKNGNNIVKINKIKSIRNDGYEPIFIIIKNNMTLLESCNLEIHYIKCIGKFIDGNGCLTNISDGGESGRIGTKMTEEQKTKLSENAKNRPHYLRGKKLSNEMRYKLRISHIGFKASEKTKALLSKMRTGKINLKSRKKYIITSPKGEEVIINGVIEFCKTYNINSGDFYRCKSGKIKRVKKWTNIREL